MNLVSIIYCFSIIISSLSIFFVGTDGMYVNRTFLNMPLSIFEANVLDKTEVGIDIKDNGLVFFFDKVNLESDVIEYLNLNLKGRVTSYKIGFQYYITDDNGTNLYQGDDPNGVQIRFVTTYYQANIFDSYLSFYINEGELTYSE